MQHLQATDQMGCIVSLPFPPQRIVSLVPSQTELLYDLGLGHKIVGRTRYCIHPESQIQHATIVGGTKQFDIQKIRDLKPDLIIGNKEENYPEGIHELAKSFSVWMSDINNVPDALHMIQEVARITDTMQIGSAIAAKIDAGFKQLCKAHQPVRVAYFIWRKPYMVAASSTFINDILTRSGMINVFNHLERYPQLTMNELVVQSPQVVLLSSEPYRFTATHIQEFQEVLPSAKVLLVDGEMFSWYGSRLLKAVEYLHTFVSESELYEKESF